ncbi:MAG: beta-lactamase family protein [Clostridiales bacterium]|nr:beta-lactamase family protein [Clostridiales bacterium]
MKKSCALILCVIIFLSMFPLTVYALSTEQAKTIQQLTDDAVRASGTPGISVAVISDGQTSYYNSGHTSVNSPSLVDEHTLYEIGSLSKAFTAAGILLLEEQGLLSAADRIEDYLPWFHVTYQNETAVVTIKNLLNQTSGFTLRHSGAPRGEGEDMLRKTVEPLLGAALDFAPGTSYAYSNANFNILGLIIETVSGQSYEQFMTEQVFEPLGLHETFLYHSDAAATGRMAQGHRLAFFTTFAYDLPAYGGMKPAGFIISSPHDMARWAGIHLGIVQDIPEIFLRVVENAHQADINGPSIEDNDYYSAGWSINTDSDILSHDGQTPSFKSYLVLFAEQKQGIVVLANGWSVNDEGLTEGIYHILDGGLQQQYAMGGRQLTDMINSVIIIFFSVSAIAELIIGIRNRIKCKPLLTKNKIIMMSVCALGTIVTLARLLTSPNDLGAGWTFIFDWNPPSGTMIQFVLPIAFAATTWYTYTQKPKKPSQKKPRTSGDSPAMR